METLKCIELKLEGDVATIRFARPDTGNAFNYVFVSELKEALELLDNSDVIRFIVFVSSDEVFCSGLDENYLFNLQRYGFNENLIDVNHLMEMLNGLMTNKKTTIAVVDGPAMSEGFVFALLCDHIVAGPNAKFGTPDVTLGRIPALTGAYLLKRLGPAVARRLLLSGATLSPQDLANLGLLQLNEADKALQVVAEELVTTLRTNTSKGSVEFTKRILNDMNELGLYDALGLAVKMTAHARDTREFKLGLAATLNNESVDWSKNDNPFAS